LSFAQIRPICAFRVKPCYKIEKESIYFEKAVNSESWLLQNSFLSL
jgi:hypothetical protein